jgi:hypothetical protein
MKSKELLILPAVLLALACGGRQEDATATASPEATAPGGSAGTMGGGASSGMASGPSFSATVVAVDTTNGSVTLREGVVGSAGGTGDLRAGDRTIRTEGGATTALSTVRPGDHVMVSCSSTPGGTVDAGSGYGSAAAPAGSGSATAPAGGTATAPVGGGMGTTAMGGGLGSCSSIVSLTPSGSASGR